MQGINFPIFKTRMAGKSKKFDLTTFDGRKAYFEYKAGPEIKKLKKYLEGGNTFIAYFLGKKSSGKGTYSKMFKEVVAPDKVEHFSVGDMVRSFDSVLKDPKKKKELVAFLEENYRGFTPLQDIMKSFESRSTKVLLPTELILALVKREIEKLGKKALFLDGFPRDLDQISYSLFFRDLVNYRQDPDVFILIDIPTSVIDERVKTRVICPICNTPRSTKLLATKEVGYDKKEKKFYLICDNPSCSSVKAGKGARMITKEGDEQGIAPIKARLDKDETLIKQAMNLQGIPKVLLRNSIPVDKVKADVDDYEITPEFTYVYDEKKDKVTTKEQPWQVLDDEGVPCNSLMPPPVVVSMIKQLVKALGL